MAKEYLFKWLEKYSKLGTAEGSSLKYVDEIVKSLEDDLSAVTEENSSDKERLRKHITEAVEHLLASVDDATKSDIRVVCSCHAIVILDESMKILVDFPDHPPIINEVSGKKSSEAPPASTSLISLQQTKLVEDTLRFVIYTMILGCLSQEASQYVKVMVARNKFVLGSNFVSVAQRCRHALLSSTMKVLLSMMKHSSLGVPLRGHLFPEVFCALLELCFAPGHVKEHPEDTAFFREKLEETLSARDTNQTLQHLLLIKGISKNGVWLQRVCGSLLVRRYMMQPKGVAAVIGAGLVICDGHDLKHCEAVAALVAHAKFPNVDLYYSTVGPQISDLMLEANLKPETLRVVMMIVSELAQRSATLTSLHVTKELLQPLIDLTTNQSTFAETSLTVCITRIHKLFVEIGIPSASLISILQPVIDPLMTIAGIPTTHLRSFSQQCILRYLNQQTTDTVVEILLHVSRLNIVAKFPTVSQDIMFHLDADGGIIANSADNASSKINVLDHDENLVKTIISILETMKSSQVVIAFYEKLVLYIDFSVLNDKKMSSTVLMTGEDIRVQQFEAVRKVLICCSLLSHLADSEQLTNDLFQNLSAAVPVVDTLLKTSCQKCDDESLSNTKTSFLLNVVMMLSCYVNEQILSQKMCSNDWTGLKSLVPSLELVKKSVSDEATLLFVEQLKNLVLTHGVIGTLPGDRGEASKQENSLKKESENPETLQIESALKSVELEKMIKGCKTTSMYKEDDMKCRKFTYKEAMQDIVNPLLPIRGHALLALGKLIEDCDPETLAHKDQLLSLFQHNMKDDDSYIYLMAIQGLATLCDTYPDKIVEILTQEFSVGKRSTEDRAKLAEVLTRASKRLGAVLPHYSPLFINSLLAGVRDTEALVRASSLSSLGEVCKLLHFSLGPIIFEIFGVLHAVIDCDKVVEVRRAAVLVVTLILQGLGRDSFSVLKDVLRDLYRVLRLVHARDSDDVVRLHAQLAIEEIDAITKEFLLPKLNLTKRIFVADVPPDGF